jgi:hypothetical protein
MRRSDEGEMITVLVLILLLPILLPVIIVIGMVLLVLALVFMICAAILPAGLYIAVMSMVTETGLVKLLGSELPGFVLGGMLALTIGLAWIMDLLEQRAMR